MKYEIMLDILFTLLAKNKVTAGYLAARHDISVRTVYRYIDEMTCAGIPIDVYRGSNGGIYISDAFKLPKGLMTREEYSRSVDALEAMLSESGDETLKSALEKLKAHIKAEKFDTSLSGNILVDSGTWGDERKFSEKLSLVTDAVNACEALEIDYVDRGGERTKRVILPHLLVYKQNIWYVYAWCRRRNAFRLFKLGRMRSVLRTGETFERIPFSREDIPLSFWGAERTVCARFLISPETLPFAEEWLGVENISERNGTYRADVQLPDDESLVGKILSAGAGLCVLEPEELRERVKSEAAKIAASYPD